MFCLPLVVCTCSSCLIQTHRVVFVLNYFFEHEQRRLRNIYKKMVTLKQKQPSLRSMSASTRKHQTHKMSFNRPVHCAVIATPVVMLVRKIRY